MLIKTFFTRLALFSALLLPVTVSNATGLSSPKIAEALSINVPEINTNGMFVVKVSSTLDDTSLQNSVFELFRNFNGGRFERVESLPRYSSISQIVKEQGRYGYKAVIRVQNDMGSSVYTTNTVSYVDVQLRNYGLIKKSKPNNTDNTKLISSVGF